jgi:hypothetical protein
VKTKTARDGSRLGQSSAPAISFGRRLLCRYLEDVFGSWSIQVRRHCKIARVGNATDETTDAAIFHFLHQTTRLVGSSTRSQPDAQSYLLFG